MTEVLLWASVALLGVSCALWLIDALQDWQDELEREMEDLDGR